MLESFVLLGHPVRISSARVELVALGRVNHHGQERVLDIHGAREECNTLVKFLFQR